MEEAPDSHKQHRERSLSLGHRDLGLGGGGGGKSREVGDLSRWEKIETHGATLPR